MATLRVTLRRVEVNPVTLSTEVTPIIRAVHSRVTRQIANFARINAPVNTGTLRNLIAEDPAVDSGPMTVRGGVTSNADYSLYVHEPTRPHVIAARKAKCLAFQWHGQQVFFKHVNHPGTKGQPFLTNAAREALVADPDITIVS